ncbi:uncharacterized protein LOC121399362 [Xenopus laevis]|uniref:Uncharacterized protein LOC121399362 n=1 Tax=Xenopus laevis TaxID=8355 RepID=A0A8J1M466_XENLA|nr:uncharacterized protein LOC121399362 [Xenopus laevis]
MKNPKIPVLYSLLKIHKDIKNPPGRPIVSGINSISCNISEYVDKILQKYVVSLPSYLKDSTQVIRDLQKVQLKQGTFLCTLDVKSLYTSIQHELGIRAVSHYLEKDHDMPTNQKEFIIEAISYILNHNYFWFEDRYYLQIWGTAMGTRFAPSYANLFLGHWEQQNITPKLGGDLVLWRSFIDDIVFLWQGSEVEMLKFVNDINKNDQNLELTSTYSQETINFLDLEIRKNKNSDFLDFKTYFKKVDVCNYVLSTSNHNPTWLKNIPYGQFCRLKKNCSNPIELENQLNHVSERFKQRGYKNKLIQKARKQLTKIDRTDLLKEKMKKQITNKQLGLSFITSYTPGAQEIKRILNRHWNILEEDELLKGKIPQKPKVIYKRANNLSQMMSA